MVHPIPESVKRIWDKWNLRGSIILSLSLQTYLILFAPFRKRTESRWVILLIWSAYLLADWVANFAVGLISNSQGGNPSDDNNYDALLAFWAPFLLLHLGGPDTITAFALEDNALWLRHMLGLIFQVIAAAYVFIQTLPKNNLWVSTLLMFLAGIIKYAERTRALFLASLDRFRESMLTEPDPGPNYAKLMEEYASKKDSKLPTHINMIAEPAKESMTVINLDKVDLNNVEVVQHAYHFFEIFKGLVVDLIFSFRERRESQLFFHKRTSEDAFKVISVELNFMYDVLYTKVAVVHSMVGYIFRFISFSTVLVALLLFTSFEKRNNLHHFDVGITYTLLLGAIALDTIAFFKLIFSDWTVVALKKQNKRSWIARILGSYLNLKWPRWSAGSPNCLQWARKILFQRWSESVSTFNLIEYCLNERPKLGPNMIDCWGIVYIEVIDLFGLKDFRDRIKYLSSKPLDKKLWDFIFEELQKKSLLADDPETANRICSARGDWVLQDSGWNTDFTSLMSYVIEVDYDQSLLLWHIATELCYNMGEDDANSNREDNIKDSREFSKILSDYMLYLLVMQPTMMSSIAGIGQIRFRDTCAEAKKFFSRRELKPEEEQKQACIRLLEVNTDVKPVTVKGDRSKSVLFDACILAKELDNKLKEKKWKLMSEVWVELLSYAASHCRANTHAQLLSKGGELITFVWLLMAHFGIGEQFQINEGHARAKLIVGK
ncbi:hypothetical protein FNV43_RR07683 [Rhamnella rubrinervis]|uniref:DUF4220 domain-containing protein n=1 Tax=Rhamnella rubrinervis TaxID=2594499 RepID=A0A8K0HH45_9ROSA|nr:hypothetical protein FNV43_RR07683 [Rhamnella rubrinervis]